MDGLFGGGGGGVGGGGSAGTISYAQHIENAHNNLMHGDFSADPTTPVTLDAGVFTAMNAADAATGGSPYATATGYDPDAVLALSQGQTDDFTSFVAALDAETDWDGDYDAAIARYDADFNADADVDAVVTQYEAEQLPVFLRQMNRFTAGMVDINAVHGSQFITGMALLESQFDAHVQGFRTRLELQQDGARANAVSQMAAQIGGRRAIKLDAHRAAVVAQSDATRLTIAGKVDQFSTDIAMEVEDALWDLNLFSFGSNVLASAAGAAVGPKAPTRAQAMFNAFATAIGPSIQIGTAVGGALGAEAGLIGGLGSFLLTGLGGANSAATSYA